MKSLPRAISLVRPRKALKKFFEGSFRVIGLVEVFFLNLSNGKKRFATISAARILLQQKFKRINGGLEIFRIKLAAHFLVQLAFGDERRRNSFGLRRDQINFVIRGDGLAVIGESSLLLRIPLKRGAHLYGAFKLLACVESLICARRRDKAHKKRCEAEDSCNRGLGSSRNDAFHSFVKTTRPFESTSFRTGGFGAIQSVRSRPEPGRKYALVTFCTYLCVSQ